MNLLSILRNALSEVVNWGIGMAVVLGLIPGASKIDKFGACPPVAAAPVDVWDGGTLYPDDEFGTAPVESIGSSSAADTMGNISVEGLDINGYKSVVEYELDGTNRVALDPPLWKVYRMENNSDTDITGQVTAYTGAGTPPTTITDTRNRAIIDNGNNQTLMAIYTVPRGYVGFLKRGEIGVELDANPANAQNFMKTSYRSKRLNGVFKVKKVVSLMTAGTSNYVDKRTFPDIIPALTDIHIRIEDLSVTMGAWATLDLMLIEQGRLKKTFLQSIGQPFPEDWE